MDSSVIVWASIGLVVLAGIIVIYLLVAIFGGQPVYLGAACNPIPTFLCDPHSLLFNTSGVYDTLGVQIGQTGLGTLYNLQLACVANYSGTTIITPVPSSAWQTISTTGEALSEKGPAINAMDLPPQGSADITGLRCYNQTGTPLANEPNGSVYNGEILANFSTIRCDGVACDWQQTKIAAFSLKVVK